MSRTLFTCQGGDMILHSSVFLSREDGGHLLVMPPRSVWERYELTPVELTLWSFLVAATGRAMLETLPQLEGGCLNYFEAGNWALNDQAEPKGPKTAKAYRNVHMHILGRSRTATDPSWRWGEAPKFSDYVDRLSWTSGHERLRAEECQEIVTRTATLLKTYYGMHDSHLTPWSLCSECRYPIATGNEQETMLCEECQTTT
jgi:diadenosine tetraphosphate (Ap4A) HIT family hydrolase